MGYKAENYDRAFNLVKKEKVASESFFQRRLKIGYVEAKAIISQLESNGVCGPSQGVHPREILITREMPGEISEYEDLGITIVDMFKKYSESDWLAAGYDSYKSVEETLLLQAKECALIHVKGIIQSLELVKHSSEHYITSHILRWKKVKEIIENK